jgi:hypothetical protein
LDNAIRKNSPLHLLENSGENFPSLAAAQTMAFPATAHDLAATIRALLTAGRLVNVNGKIIPARL